MRWTILLMLILSCAREVYTAPPTDFPQIMIENLENGFEFHWIVEREKDGFKSTFVASGEYKGAGDFYLEGTLKVGDTEEPIFEINPYAEINNLTGKRDFVLISHKEDELVYFFTANLSLFSPGGKEGEGKLIIKKERIKKISAKTTDIDWEMNIEPRGQIERKSIEIAGDIDPNILKDRLEYYGQRRVEVKGNRIYFEEVIPINRDGLLFNKGDYSIYAITHTPEGELLLSPDSIESYNRLIEIETEIEDIRVIANERGGYWITVDFTRPVEEVLIGILIDGELFGIGHPSGLSLGFTVKYDRLTKEIYAILKTHTDLRKN
ncbi:hypothetical protein KAT89_06525 [candidate division WOR-3 bacterium]|nr:hypothetical protein [candidate division WOR-3 bacterium]